MYQLVGMVREHRYKEIYNMVIIISFLVSDTSSWLDLQSKWEISKIAWDR